MDGGNAISDPLAVDRYAAFASSNEIRGMGLHSLRLPLDPKMGGVGRQCHDGWQDKEWHAIKINVLWRLVSAVGDQTCGFASSNQFRGI